MAIFILYLICINVGGTIYIGPVSIRVIATCLMILYLFYVKTKNKKYVKIDQSYIKLYVLFTVIMGCALLLNGEFSEFEFIKKVLAFNLVAIISFFSIERIINSSRQIYIVIFSLLSLLLFNNIITIMQYNGNPIGWSIGYVFSDIGKWVEKTNEKDTLLGISATPGIFGDVVKNAFYIAIVSPLSFCLVKKKTNFLTIGFVAIMMLSSGIAIYMSQQRIAFGIILLTVIIWISMFLKSRPVIALISSLIICFLSSVIVDLAIETDWGRLTETHDAAREILKSEAIDFINANPLVGGPVSFIKKAGLPAHNLILDSFIYSGIFGFIIMMILLSKTVWISVKTIFIGIKSKQKAYITVFSSISVLNSMVYGLFHNTSYLTGEVIIFILLALMLKINVIASKSITKPTPQCNLIK